MNFERYTTKAAEAVQGTLELAATLGQQALGPLHVLLILLNQKEGLVPTLLQKLKDEYISTEHLFLALLDQEEVQKVLPLKKKEVLEVLRELRGSQRVTDRDPEGKYQVLEKYTQDFTRLARDGKIDPVIGRDDEIRRIMQILSRRTKN